MVHFSVTFLGRFRAYAGTAASHAVLRKKTPIHRGRQDPVPGGMSHLAGISVRRRWRKLNIIVEQPAARRDALPELNSPALVLKETCLE